jgi:hypothetical protein
MLIMALYTEGAVNINLAPALAGVDATKWTALEWRKFKKQLILYTPAILYTHPALGVVVLVHGDVGPSLLSSFKFAVESKLERRVEESIDSVPASSSSSVERAPGEETRGRKSLLFLFPDVLNELKAFVEVHSSAAQERRRDSAQHLGSSDGKAEGFTLEGAREYLFLAIPGLYSHGIDLRTIHHLFHPPSRRAKAVHTYI